MIKYIIFNASFKQAETEGLHILREVIPDFWALIVESALPGTCSTVGSMQLTILACKMRMDITIHLKAKQDIGPYPTLFRFLYINSKT